MLELSIIWLYHYFPIIPNTSQCREYTVNILELTKVVCIDAENKGTTSYRMQDIIGYVFFLL